MASCRSFPEWSGPLVVASLARVLLAVDRLVVLVLAEVMVDPLAGHLARLARLLAAMLVLAPGHSQGSSPTRLEASLCNPPH